MDEVRWGMIGAGDVAEYKSGPPLYTVDQSRLVAVMSRKASRAEDFATRHHVDRYYTSVEDVLTDENVNAVYIATPPNVHAELTEMAARAGKDTYVEKPLGTSAWVSIVSQRT